MAYALNDRDPKLISVCKRIASQLLGHLITNKKLKHRASSRGHVLVGRKALTVQCLIHFFTQLCLQ
ncbi:hypothetical protein T4D_983 [Trichinella pseudospiralis]|uniref:Uncharacterized protein n=1 Tax=Trichinella pseudospiralis TaxID=6337 RepID=A0A0V1FS77_TRIPS|nr:hypothetical protein T4D_983 [Trichinella pseudospiralis]